MFELIQDQGNIRFFVWLTAFLQFWYAFECIRCAARIKGPMGYQSEVMKRPAIRKAVFLQYASALAVTALAICNITQTIGLYIAVCIWVMVLISEKRWTVKFHDAKEGAWRNKIEDRLEGLEGKGYGCDG